MMQLRFKGLFRFCLDNPKTRIEKAMIEQHIKNDRERIFRQYTYDRSNLMQSKLDNFKKNKNDPIYLDRCEIQTRILKRIYNSEIIDLKAFSFDKDLREQLKIDSLNLVVILTEIQNEFTTVFEDKVFESVRRLEEIVDILARDEKVF